MRHDIWGMKHQVARDEMGTTSSIKELSTSTAPSLANKGGIVGEDMTTSRCSATTQIAA